MLAFRAYRDPAAAKNFLTTFSRRGTYTPVPSDPNKPYPAAPNRLSLRATSWLALEFCLLWYIANYFVSACLEYTTVSSGTILTSTSSIFTLIFGVAFRSG